MLGKVLEECAGGKARVSFKAVGEKIISLNHVALSLVTGEEAKVPILDNSRVAASKSREEYKGIEQMVRSTK